MWLLFAFSGPVLWALSTHIDKYLVERYFKNSDTAVLMVFTALIGLIMLPFIWYFAPGDVLLPALSVLVMLVSGILYMGSMLFYLRAIQTEEASVIAPLFQLLTIFTFALAYIFLGETLGIQELMGLALIILGALALSVRGRSVHAPPARLILCMSAATFALALASVIFKYFAIEGTFWGTTFWTYAGEALFGAGILLVPAYRRQFFALFRQEPGAIMTINGVNEIVNLGGGLGVRFASLLAPVALVSAVSSTTTLFVFGFGILLTLFAPSFAREDLSRANLARKGIAALFVAAGVILANAAGGGVW